MSCWVGAGSLPGRAWFYRAFPFNPWRIVQFDSDRYENLLMFKAGGQGCLSQPASQQEPGSASGNASTCPAPYPSMPMTHRGNDQEQSPSSTSSFCLQTLQLLATEMTAMRCGWHLEVNNAELGYGYWMNHSFPVVTLGGVCKCGGPILEYSIPHIMASV